MFFVPYSIPFPDISRLARITSSMGCCACLTTRFDRSGLCCIPVVQFYYPSYTNTNTSVSMSLKCRTTIQFLYVRIYRFQKLPLLSTRFAVDSILTMEEVKFESVKRKRTYVSTKPCTILQYFESLLYGDVDDCLEAMQSFNGSTHLCLGATASQLWLACSSPNVYKVNVHTLQEILTHTSQPPEAVMSTISCLDWYCAVLCAFPNSEAHFLAITAVLRQELSENAKCLCYILRNTPRDIRSKLILTLLQQGCLSNYNAAREAFQHTVGVCDPMVSLELLNYYDKLGITEKMIQRCAYKLFQSGDISVVRRAISYNIHAQSFQFTVVRAALLNPDTRVVETCASKFHNEIRKNASSLLLTACTYGHVDPFARIGYTYENSWPNVQSIAANDVCSTVQWHALKAMSGTDYPRVVSKILSMFHPDTQTTFIIRHIGLFCGMGPNALRAALLNVNYAVKWDDEAKHNMASNLLVLVNRLRVKHLMTYLHFLHGKFQVPTASLLDHLHYAVADHNLLWQHSCDESRTSCGDALRLCKVIAILSVYDMIKLQANGVNDETVLCRCGIVVQSLIEQAFMFRRRQALRIAKPGTPSCCFSKVYVLEYVLQLCDTLSCKRFGMVTDTN